MSPRPATIRDISAATGLSTYSVSQALAGKPGVGAATRSKVLRVADELGYVANRLAANLKDATSRTIGVMSANAHNTYYAILVQAIDAAVREAGYHAVTNDSMRADTYQADTERQGVEDLLQQRVAAIVATYSLSPASLALLERWDVPVVFADSLPPAGADTYPFVGVDNFSASAKVAHHLADLGHRDVAYLAFPPEWNTRAPRQEGFTTTAAARGMTVRILEAHNSAESGEQVVRALLATDPSSWPTALYATNVVLLQGALKALKSALVAIPGDISVIGFDDFDWADLIDPPITVIDQHINDVGAATGRTVLDLIRSRRHGNPTPPVANVLLPTDITIRQSCAAPPTRRSRHPEPPAQR